MSPPATDVPSSPNFVGRAAQHSIRTRAKDFTDKKVEGFYQLAGGDESKKMSCRTHEDCQLHLPWCFGVFYLSFLQISPISIVVQTGTSLTKEKRAYFHPAIVASLRDYFFIGSWGSLADKPCRSAPMFSLHWFMYHILLHMAPYSAVHVSLSQISILFVYLITILNYASFTLSCIVFCVLIKST